MIIFRVRETLHMIQKLLLLALLASFQANAQKGPIKIVTEDIPNRLAFYALNETEQDYDVMLTIKGTNFRQSKARPRLIRVPGATKVRLKVIVPTRGKKPNYTYDLVVNDSLSRRALKVDYKRIKINPKKSITVYVTEACLQCDSITQPLEGSNYRFKTIRLAENPEIKDQLKGAFARPLDTIEEPIINLGGRLYTTIDSYDRLLEELDKE